MCHRFETKAKLYLLQSSPFKQTHTGADSDANIKTYGRVALRDCRRTHNNLDILSGLYSCGEATQRRFHLHAGLSPSNTFEKEQFCVRCGGPFVTGMKLCKHSF